MGDAVEQAPLGPMMALVVVQFSFASLAVAGEYTLDAGVPPLALAAIRVLFASLLLATIALARFHEHIPWTDVAKLAGLSLLGVVFNQILFLEGLERTTAIDASILIVTIPVFTLAVAVLLGRERFNRSRALGVTIALAGTLALLRVERFALDDQVVLGNILVILNCLSYSFYLVLARDILQRYRSIPVVAWTFLLGALLMVPLGTPDFADARNAGVFTTGVGLALVWIILVPSVVSYSLNNFALKRLHASTVGAFVMLQPLFGTLMALAVLPGEHLDVRTAIAGALILAGVLVVARSEARTRSLVTVKPINEEAVPADRGRP